MGVSDHPEDENRVSGSKRGVCVQGYVDRALGFVVPAYGGAMRAYRSARDHSASARERASLAGIGGLGGAVLSWMASVVVGAMWEREAVIASAPDITYTLHAQPRVENAAAGTASKLVSPFAYAAFLTHQPTDVTGRVEVSFRDATDRDADGGIEARCRYRVSISPDTQFDTLRDDPPIVTLDSLGRPVSLAYGGETVPPGSRIGRTIEGMCDEILESELEDLNRSIR